MKTKNLFFQSIANGAYISTVNVNVNKLWNVKRQRQINTMTMREKNIIYYIVSLRKKTEWPINLIN